MKNLNTKFFLGLLIIMISLNLSAKAWVYSTAEGGQWDDPSTWVAGVVPGITDDVVLNGPVHTNGDTCNNLSISTSGELFNTNYTITFTANGNVINNGSIRNKGNGWHLDLNVGGDITNNGTWTNRNTFLIGTGTHALLQTGDNKISCYEFNVATGTGLITVMSDFNFHNTRIILNGATIELDNSKGSNLFVNGQFIDNGSLIANHHNLYMEGNAYIEDITLFDATLTGVIQTQGPNVIFTGNTVLNGTLQNYNNNSNITITGEFTNNGIVKDKGNGWHLYMDIFGNIFNNGIWNNYDIQLMGESDHNISCLNQNVFAVNVFSNEEPIASILSLTDLYFNNCALNLNNGTLQIPPGGNIYLSGGNFKNANIFSQSGTINFYSSDNNYFENISIQNAELYDLIQINGNNVIFTGNTILQGTIQNYNSNSNLTLTGDFTNNGVVKDKGNGWHLYMDHFGNIINNGIWNNYDIQLMGESDHNISCLNQSEFSVNVFSNEEPIASILSITDLYFSNCAVNLNSSTLEMPPGSNIYLSGGNFKNANVFSQTGSISLFSSGNTYFENLSIQNPELYGFTQINGNTIVFTGNTVLQDTMQNYNGNSHLTLNCDFTNNGVVKDKGNGWHLYMDNFGDIINDGVWDNYEIELYGEVDQNISCLNENVFSVFNFIDQKPGGLINALTDIYFVDCKVNLNYNTLVMPENSTLSILNDYIKKAVVYPSGNSFTMNINNSAYIEDCDFSDLTLTGEVKCNSTDFYGNIILEGTMQNHSGNVTLNINGNLTNHGIIKNNGTGWNLTLYITGNLINNGEWSNYQTKLTGTIEQHIYLLHHNDITSQVQFVSDIMVSPYQWYFNGNSLPPSPEYSGQTTHIISFNIPVTEEFDGVFNCSTGGGYSRDIIVESIYGPPIANFAADVTSWYAPMEVNFTDLSAAGNAPIAEWYWNFGDGNTSTLQNPTHTYENLGHYTVSLTVTDENGLYDTETKIDYIKVLSVQQIDLSDGYSFISTRIIPDDPDFQAICSDILSNLDFVRNTAGDMFRKIGPVWVNGIGDWITTEGYLFRMNDADELIILGEVIDPQISIALMQGYQFISYLPENSINALTVFNDVLENLDFVRNSVGGMLRKIGPIWINGIGDMNPGEGYLVKMINSDELIYPVTDDKFTGIPDLVPEYFQFDGGNAADPVYTIYIEGLNISDEVAAYDGDKMIGSLKIKSQNAFENDLAVFNTINSGQGYQSGNSITLKIWDSFTQKTSIAEFEMIDAYNEAYIKNTYPEVDGLFSIVKIAKSLIGDENIDNEITIYPNPSNGVITIENLTGLSLEIADLRGRIIFKSEIKNQTKRSKPVWESKMKIDLSDLESGVYFIRNNGINFTKVEKIVIQ